MRVLFCSAGSAGHMRPMRPLAHAFRQRGHDVGWATAPDALDELDGFGVEPLAAGLPMTTARQRYRQRWPEARVLRGEALSAHTFPRLFGGVVAPSMLDDLDRIVSTWQPDLVINESAALAAPLVCVRRRVRHVTHAFGLRVPPSHLRAAMAEFGSCWEAAGQAAPADGGLYRHLYLDIAPPSLQPAPAHAAVPTQALSPATPPATDRHALPAALERALSAARRPVIYLSFGTVFNRHEALHSAARALAALDAQIVVTVGHDGDPASLAALPAHVHVERHVDQDALLSRCAAVVSHAGAGTMLGAAVHGLPQLLLPLAADQFRNAAAVAATGAARVILPPQMSVEAVADGVRALLASAPMRASAGRLAAEIAAMPSALEVAASLERQGGGHHPGASP
jgi:UDP:flavonoid glycosyltransferase YjiC (YdhE family)